MNPSQIALGGAFYILLPKRANKLYGRFSGNIDDDDHWIGGHFYPCTDAQEAFPDGRQDTCCVSPTSSCYAGSFF